MALHAASNMKWDTIKLIGLQWGIKFQTVQAERYSQMKMDEHWVAQESIQSIRTGTYLI